MKSIRIFTCVKRAGIEAFPRYAITEWFKGLDRCKKGVSRRNRKITTEENTIKKTFGKRLAIALDFHLLKHPVYS